MIDPRTIVITGASSGIGEALAAVYAAPGRTLALTGRNGDRLAAVAARCRSAGAAVVDDVVDVTDGPAMADWLARIDADTKVDLAIANAGVSAGTGGDGERPDQVRRIFSVNMDGVLNTVLPLIEPMRRRRSGQLALMSSMAAFRGFPGAPAYSGSKAAVRCYGEGLRGALCADGVGVSVICPGFVRSRMTEVNRFRMPFLMDADRAARIIQRGLARNQARIAFPFPTYLGAWLIAALPTSVADPMLRRLPQKSAQDPESQ